MKYFTILFISVFLFSCNQREEKYNTENEIVFKNTTLEANFKEWVNLLEESGEGLDSQDYGKNVLIEFYIDPYEDYDTIVAIKYCPPVSVRNLVLHRKYGEADVYVYSDGLLRKRLATLIDMEGSQLQSVNLKPVNEYECIYSKRLELRNNDIVPKVYSFE